MLSISSWLFIFTEEDAIAEGLMFQSTLPRGSDWILGDEVDDVVKFQSTLPRGSDGLVAIFWESRPKHTKIENVQAGPTHNSPLFTIVMK
jgi:hypothetical protein